MKYVDNQGDKRGWPIYVRQLVSVFTAGLAKHLHRQATAADTEVMSGPKSMIPTDQGQWS